MKKYVSLMAVLLLALLIVGCGGKGEAENAKPTALVIIAGRHANANMYTEEMVKRAEGLIQDSFLIERDSSGYTAKAQVAVIVSDGAPTKVRLALEDNEDILTCTAPNRQLLKPELAKVVENLTAFLRSDELRADDPEVDLLGALNEAQKELRNYPDAEHHILILDTGITTAGALDMQWVNILEEECAGIVEQIRDGIPNLDGAKVTFLNLGNVGGDQYGLGSVPAENRLEELWTAIIEAANGKLEEIRFAPQEGEAMVYTGEDSGYEYVKPILFIEENARYIPEPLKLRAPEAVPAEVPTDEPTFEAILSDVYLGFMPNSDQFRYENQASGVINSLRGPLEDFLNSNDQASIYVVGSIAKIRPDMTLRENDVSRARAERVADKLVNELHIPADRVITIDAGVTEFSWRCAEEFPNNAGSVDVEAQKKNRVVAIFGENSTDLVQELRDNGYIN